MFRLGFTLATRLVPHFRIKIVQKAPQFLALQTTRQIHSVIRPINSSLSTNPAILNLIPSALNLQVPNRTVIKYSLTKGKRKTCRPALKRFFRLHWGGWIRTRCGRHKKMWKKGWKQRYRLKQHVFVNSNQAILLDKMAPPFWRKPKHYINDPYAPYHERPEFFTTKITKIYE